MLNVLFFYISTFRSMCAVHNMAVFCSSLISCFPGMLFKYFLNDFQVVPVAPSIPFVFMLIIIIIIIIKFLFNNAPSQHKGGCTLRVSLPVLQPHIYQSYGPIFSSIVDPYLPVLWTRIYQHCGPIVTSTVAPSSR